MLCNKEAFHMGVPVVPLSLLYTEPSLKCLTALGSSVRLRTQAMRIMSEAGSVEAVELADGTQVSGDYYVSTLPPERLAKLLPDDLLRSHFEKLDRFESSPITAIYLWFDREVTNLDYAALLGREIQWIFKKRASTDGSSYLGLVVSASNKLRSLGRREILEIALNDLKEIMPAVRSAKLQNGVVIKEPFATFSCRAGCDPFRPEPESPLSNFFLAGDWTNTGWPPTMESAVRSGYRCAELILKAEGKSVSILQPDLPKHRLARWLAKW
jgi:uncharacterized protein with NAD-binding domain and iron-sulfur cluster